MANPARALFNDAGALPAGWSFRNFSGSGSYQVEGAGGLGMLSVRSYGGHFAFNQMDDVRTTLVGDFDFVVVVRMSRLTSANPFIAASLYIPSIPADYFGVFSYGETNSPGWTALSHDGYTGAAGSTYRTSHVHDRPFDHGFQHLRFSRYSGVVRIHHLRGGYLSPSGAEVEGWTECVISAGGPSAFHGSVTEDLTFAIGAAASGGGHAVLVRGIIPLTLDGVGSYDLPDPCAAPASGKAFSAPSADDVDLGVGFSWAAPASGVARVVEVLTATDSGFTAGVQRHVLDFLMDGEKPSHRRGGVTVGQTIYGKARFIDELNQVGSWSATVNAVAAVTPVASSSVYASPSDKFAIPASPVFTVPDRRFSL